MPKYLQDLALQALKDVVAELDYDLWKNYEYDMDGDGGWETLGHAQSIIADALTAAIKSTQ